MDMVALYCDLDDFYQAFAPAWQPRLLPAPGRHRQRPSCLSVSEIMTLVIAFHDSDYRTLQTLLPQRGLPALASGISPSGQLSTSD